VLPAGLGEATAERGTPRRLTVPRRPAQYRIGRAPFVGVSQDLTNEVLRERWDVHRSHRTR